MPMGILYTNQMIASFMNEVESLEDAALES